MVRAAHTPLAVQYKVESELENVVKLGTHFHTGFTAPVPVLGPTAQAGSKAPLVMLLAAPKRCTHRSSEYQPNSSARKVYPLR